MLEYKPTEYKMIGIPGLEEYYAGPDGEIYKLKRNSDSGIDQFRRLSPFIADRKMGVKYVHLLFNCPEKEYSFTIKLPVCYLVCGAFKGFYKPFHDVSYLDGNINNTSPDNLQWTFSFTEKKINKLRDSLEKIAEHYNKEK